MGPQAVATIVFDHGANEYEDDWPGVFMMFEENAAELTANVRSLGFDLAKLAARRRAGHTGGCALRISK